MPCVIVYVILSLDATPEALLSSSKLLFLAACSVDSLDVT